MKRYKLKYMFSWSILIISLFFLLVVNWNKNKVNEVNWERYMIIGKENVFVVYEDKLAVRIPFEITLDKQKNIGDYVKKGNYEELLVAINEVLPEKVENYKVVKSGKVKFNVKNEKNIPEIAIDDKRLVLTSSLTKMFMEVYNDQIKTEDTDSILVDILNANGKSGYARKTGETLKRELSYRYNAANYTQQAEYSYIIKKNISDKNLEDMVLNLNEKYFKLKPEEELDVPTIANVVLVIGNEEKDLLEINLLKNGTLDRENYGKLNKLGYKNLNRSSVNASIEENFIEYNGEDYYTAYKLSTLLNIPKRVENNQLKEEINVYLK